MDESPTLFREIEMKSNECGIKLTQSSYAKSICTKFMEEDQSKSKVSMARKKLHYRSTKNDSPSHRSEYFRSAVGAILYLANITRPDLAFYASFLGAHVANPKPHHLDMLKGLLKYI